MPSALIVLAAAALALAGLAGHAAAAAAAPGLSIAPVHGTVHFVTEKRAYLDRGAADGLDVGQSIQLVRTGRPLVRCLIETIADHEAVCRATGVHVGDTFAASAIRARKRAEPGPTLPPPLDDNRLHARSEAIAGAANELVDFVAHGSASLPPMVAVSAGYNASASTPAASGGPYGNEEIDAELRRVRLGDTDLRFDTSFTAVHWSTRPTTERFQPGNATQFFLWDAEVSRREVEDRTVFAAGRVWPYHIPGVPMLDGVQVGYRNPEATAEGGAYVGQLPLSLTLAPTLDRWTGGVYGALTQSGTKADFVQLAREEARIAVRESSGAGAITEAEGLAEVWLPMFALDAGGREYYAPSIDSAPTLEQAYVDLRLRPTAHAGAWVQFRYIGVSPEEEAALINETPSLHGGVHVSWNGFYNPRDWLGVGVSGSSNTDKDSGLHETEAELELHLPKLLGPFGGLYGGVGVGTGWLSSRSGYVQFLGARTARVHIIARVTGSTTSFTVPGEQANVTEIGGYFNAEATITPKLKLRARSTIRVPLLIQGLTPTDQSLGIEAGIDALVIL